MHDQELRALAREVAAMLPRVYAEKGKRNLSEMHHLQPATNDVAARLAATWNPPATLVGKQFGPNLGWVGLGHVDTVLHWPDGPQTFLELKCDWDLCACVWDAVKLAAGVLNGNADAGYMLAGAPARMWNKSTPGAELFASGRWETMGAEVRGRYRKWWWNWQEEVVDHRSNRHIPGAVAAIFETVPLGTFPFVIGGASWELRLARVDPNGSEWSIWTCVPPD
jgi:hypothetical protein